MFELQDSDMEPRKVQPSVDQGPSCLDIHDFSRTTTRRPSLQAFSAFPDAGSASTIANSSNSHSVQDGSSDEGSSPLPPQIRRQHPSLRHSTAYHDERSSGNSLVIVDALEGSRPKIWSLAQTATSDSPPGLRKSPGSPLSDRYGFQQRLLNDASAANASVCGYYRDLHTDPSFMSTAQPLPSHLGSDHSNSKPMTSPWINGHSPILQTSSPTGHPDVLNLTPDSSPTSYVIGQSGLGSMSPQAQQTALTTASGRFPIVEEKESSVLRNEQCIVKPEVNTGEYEPASLEMSRGDARNFCRGQQSASRMALQGTCLSEAASRLSVHPLYTSSVEKHDKGSTKNGPHRLHPPQSMVSTSSSPSSCMSNCTAFKPVSKSDVKSM